MIGAVRPCGVVGDFSGTLIPEPLVKGFSGTARFCIEVQQTALCAYRLMLKRVHQTRADAAPASSLMDQ